MDGDNAMQALAQYTDDYLLAAKVPRCKVAYATPLNIANNAATDITMTGATVVHDTAAMADLPNNCIVIRQAGLYVVSVCVMWAAISGPVGCRMMFMVKNGTTYVGQDYRAAASTSATGGVLVSDPLPFAVGDTIRGRVMHTQGATASIASSNGVPNHLSVSMWMGQ
jgi:hypothetical protein